MGTNKSDRMINRDTDLGISYEVYSISAQERSQLIFIPIHS